MPRKPHFEVLVFRKSVWLSIYYSQERGMQLWRIYKHPRGAQRSLGRWWLNLMPTDLPMAMRNTDLPTPILRAYAYTEWTWGEPDGTDLWVPSGAPNEYLIWHSPVNWPNFLGPGQQEWVYSGLGYWEP